MSSQTKDTLDHLSLFGYLSFSLFSHSIVSKMVAETSGIIFVFKIGRIGKVEFVWFTLPRTEKNNSGEFLEILL